MTLTIDTAEPLTLSIGDEWMEQFRSFKKSAFRLEVLQSYAEPSEADVFAAYKKGEKISESWTKEWCNLVSSHKRNGRQMKRIHLVDLPLSQYLRFEIQCAYVYTGKAGEDIYLLDR